ncbi:pilus assembly protein [Kineococcus esterisolvens]|uniref:pilus assembly protein n=1 Tax=unclassified Kineococcus TaxID=2621656 RepID=UPI003D7E71CD
MTPRRVRGCGDGGSASVEFLAVGVLLLVPLAYLVLTLGRVQAATFAAEAGAREASRVLATTSGDGRAEVRAEAAVALALGDQGFAVVPGSLVLECAARPCRSPQARVVATVRVEVALPLVPGFVRGAVPAVVPVQVRRVAVADRFAPS